jgi:assimilatory nitrate reductase electron transfer subunit
VTASRIVVVGFGLAATRFVDDLLAWATKDLAITVLGADERPAYNRMLLSEVVAGRTHIDALSVVHLPGWHARGVDVRLGSEVTEIHRSSRAVQTQDGRRFAYDMLVLATGARPVLPDLPVLGAVSPPESATMTPAPSRTVHQSTTQSTHQSMHPRALLPGPPQMPFGVTPLRSLDDCRRVLAALPNTRRAVVLGGGLLGLEAAHAIATRGIPVVVVQSAPHLLPQWLDPEASAILQLSLRRAGVTTRTAVRASGLITSAASTAGTNPGEPRPDQCDSRPSKACRPGPHQPGPHQPGAGRPDQVQAVLLDDGSRVAADLVLIATGVRPDTELAARAGLRIGRGIVVDDTLASSDPAIFALGDCAEHAGRTPGLVAPAWAQARALALRLSGADPEAVYRPDPTVARLKAGDLDLVAAGRIEPGLWTDEPGISVAQLADPAAGRYLKVVVERGRLAGLVCLGDARAGADLTLMVGRLSPVPQRISELITVGAQSGTRTEADPAVLPNRTPICRCNGVTKGDLISAWSQGARTRAAVSRSTRAATGCGTCTDAVDGILTWLHATDPDVPSSMSAASTSAPVRPDAQTPAPLGGVP